VKSDSDRKISDFAFELCFRVRFYGQGVLQVLVPLDEFRNRSLYQSLVRDNLDIGGRGKAPSSRA
jgi:hypothetical protein